MSTRIQLIYRARTPTTPTAPARLMPRKPESMAAPESAESVEEASEPELVVEPVASASLEEEVREREALVDREVLLPEPLMAVPLPPAAVVPLEPAGMRVPVPRTVGAEVTGLLVMFATAEEMEEEAPSREETPAASVGTR